MEADRPIGLFEGYGVELEYMIVDKQSLDVLPVADKVLHAVSGTYEAEVELGDICWSNELVLHVIELKTNGPVGDLAGLPEKFQEHIQRINDILRDFGGMLMPTAMHPWMNPWRETRLWPHEYNPVYEAFNRIFNCRGHGWANLQSTHLNLPFANDEEFGRLHTAIRLLLPIIPALSASSPIFDEKANGLLDARLAMYQLNQRRIPSITGLVIPEIALTQAEYERLILAPIYTDIAPHDPDRILQFEWLNSRGAIARFMRNTIEIRVLDIQEFPASDIAIVAAITAVLKAITAGRWIDLDEQRHFETVRLKKIFDAVIQDAEQTRIEDRQYLAAFNFPAPTANAGELWQHLLDALASEEALPLAHRHLIDSICDRGTLARRILQAVNGNFDRAHLTAVYRTLCSCLADGQPFSA